MATDDVTNEALDALRAAVTTLVPPIAGGATRRSVSVTPLRLKPAGLGGYVGTEQVVVNNVALTRELPVRRVEAQVGMIVTAESEANVEAGAAAAAAALLTVDRRQLRELGLLRVAVQEPRAFGVSATAPEGSFARELLFRVDYEFVKRTVPTEGIIEQIPLKSVTDGQEETTIIRGEGG